MLKNAIDWSSQEHPIVWQNKPGLLMGAAPSSIGAQRALWALRVPLEALGACSSRRWLRGVEPDRSRSSPFNG